MSALFKRNDKTTIAELEEYYTNQKQNRPGAAWFMSLLSLLITIAVIVGLFFAGRWAYRTVINSDDISDTTTSESGDADDVALPAFDSDETGERGISFENSETDNKSDVVQGDLSEPVNEGVVSDEAASTDESNVDRLAVAGDEIPDTGAGETVMVILLVTTVFGYLVARKHQLNS